MEVMNNAKYQDQWMNYEWETVGLDLIVHAKEWDGECQHTCPVA